MKNLEQNKEIAQEKSMSQRNLTKSIITLMGLVNGIVCDNQLNDNEVIFLSSWMSDNEEIASSYPANVIYRRVREVLQDGIITQEERDHLLNELKIISGNQFTNTGSALPEHISSIFDDDPHVIIEGNVFVFTGEFLYGTREHCKRVIEKSGGITAASVTSKTNYLIVGSRSSPDWIAENFGRKFQKAAEMVQSGNFEISVVREADWTMAI